MGRVLPILFNTDMVRAILDGRKTVTRRVISHVKIEDVLNSPARIDNPDIPDQRFISCLVDSPYEPGDILYVRETWRTISAVSTGRCKIEYRAGGTEEFDEIVALPIRKGRWRPSIHMPKAAARIWLKVTDVRVERLQEITEEQAREEGGMDNRGLIHSPENEYADIHTAREDFIKNIWNRTVKKKGLQLYGWDANPWVWIIEFERCEKPEEG